MLIKKNLLKKGIEHVLKCKMFDTIQNPFTNCNIERSCCTIINEVGLIENFTYHTDMKVWHIENSFFIIVILQVTREWNKMLISINECFLAQRGI